MRFGFRVSGFVLVICLRSNKPENKLETRNSQPETVYTLLDFQALRQQLNEFTSHQLQFQEDAEAGLRWVVERFKELSAAHHTWRTGTDDEKHAKLMAIPLEESPSVFVDGSTRPTPMTVVASDGSQIYPDRHREPLWYLINVSKIAFQYGTTEKPCLESVPSLFFRGQALDGLDAEQLDVTGRDVISAFRDELELRTLLELAQDHQKKDRPLLAIADGTLIRWMLRGIKNPELEAILLSRYVDVLDGFRKVQIPLCSYISMPGNKEFVRLLVHQVVENPSEREDKIERINDRLFFDRVLPKGARSALFKSQSKILSEYNSELQVCYFYVHVVAGESTREIARVELPIWMAKNDSWINLVHATVLSEAQKGRGYPMILSEAHEHAVVRGSERSLFYEMIEQLSVEHGKPLLSSMKQRAKEHNIL